MNVGVFVAAALLLDVVLWLFVLLGWESVAIPDNFASTHQPEFVFPWSHGLAASLVWSALAAVGAWTACARLGAARARAAVLIGVAVFSHWLIDALVHQPELPLAVGSSPKVGLGLWQNMSIALAVEAVIVAIGLFLFVPGSRMSRGKSIALTALALVILAFTMAGMTIAPPPPSAQVVAASSLAILVVVCVLAYWLGRPPHAGQA